MNRRFAVNETNEKCILVRNFGRKISRENLRVKCGQIALKCIMDNYGENVIHIKHDLAKIKLTVFFSSVVNLRVLQRQGTS
jgi:hypothetical protein